MKTLIDDTEVSSRTYYYLLDFNDEDRWETIFELFGTKRLCELEIEQYAQLYEIAGKRDLEYLKNKLIKN